MVRATLNLAIVDTWKMPQTGHALFLHRMANCSCEAVHLSDTTAPSLMSCYTLYQHLGSLVGECESSAFGQGVMYMHPRRVQTMALATVLRNRLRRFGTRLADRGFQHYHALRLAGVKT